MLHSTSDSVWLEEDSLLHGIFDCGLWEEVSMLHGISDSVWLEEDSLLHGIFDCGLWEEVSMLHGISDCGWREEDSMLHGISDCVSGGRRTACYMVYLTVLVVGGGQHAAWYI